MVFYIMILLCKATLCRGYPGNDMTFFNEHDSDVGSITAPVDLHVGTCSTTVMWLPTCYQSCFIDCF